MAQQTINNKYQGENGLSSRTKINSNFNELYYKSDNIDYNLLKNKIVDFSEKCYLNFNFHITILETSVVAKYLFWSSPTTDYCIYNPLSDGWNGEIPRIEGRTSVSLFDLPVDVFNVDVLFDNQYAKIENKEFGKCKSPFSVETLTDLIFDIDYKDYPIVDFSNNGKINKSSVEGLESNLVAIENEVTIINESLIPILQPEETFDYTTYTYNLNSLTAVWEQDWLVLDLTIKPTYDIRNFKSIIEIDNRFVNITPVFALPIYTTIPVLKLYIRDTDGVLSKYNNLGRIFIQFDLYKHTSDEYYEHIEYNTLLSFPELIPNIIIGGFHSEHDNKCKDAVESAVPEFLGNIYIAADMAELFMGLTIPHGKMNEIAVSYSSDIIALPMTIMNVSYNRLLPVQLSHIANPNILTTIPHYGNINQEFDFFNTETEFFDGVILCGAVVTDFVFSNSTTSYDVDPITHKGLFHYSYGHGLEFVVDFAILYPDTVYNNSYLQLEPIALIPSESYATSIIAAQLKLIKLATKSTWLEVRLAARATASNNGVWDKYKGFGHINVNAAIAYIEGNYNNQSIEIGKRYSQEKGYSDKLQYEHIYNNTPIPKRLIEEKLSTKADLENDKVKSSQIPSNVLLSDGSVQMGTQVQSILSDQYLIDSYTNTSINIAGDLRSMFSIGNYIKAYGAGTDYYMTILTVAYYSVQNYTKLTFVSQGNISYFFVVKISNIPTIYTPFHDEDISNKRYVDTKQEKITFDNTIEQKTLIDTDKVLIQDNAGAFKWISFLNLINQIKINTGLQLGQRYLGGTIIRLNEDRVSGLIGSYEEWEDSYENAIITFGILGNYTHRAYTNWRLPTIDELRDILTYCKNEISKFGDFNEDGVVNQEDLDLFNIQLTEGISLESLISELGEETAINLWYSKYDKYDLNKDLYIDISDTPILLLSLTNTGFSVFTYNNYISITSSLTDVTKIKTYTKDIYTKVTDTSDIGFHLDLTTPKAIEEKAKNINLGIRLVRNF